MPFAPDKYATQVRSLRKNGLIVLLVFGFLMSIGGAGLIMVSMRKTSQVTTMKDGDGRKDSQIVQGILSGNPGSSTPVPAQ